MRMPSGLFFLGFFIATSSFSEEKLLSPSDPFEGETSSNKVLADGITLAKAKTGLLLTDNRPGNHYTVAIDCKACRTMGDTSQQILFEADGKVIQALIVPISEFIPDRDVSALPDDKVLQAQMDYEIEYISGAVKKPIPKPESQSIAVAGDKKGLLWGFTFPPGVGKFYKQFYATYKLRDRVLVFMGGVQKKNEEAAIKEKLQKIMSSLRVQ